MGIEFKALLIFGTLILFFFSGFPVAFSLMSVAIIYFLIFVGPGTLSLVFFQIMRVGLTDIYIAVPLFVFMAALLQASGISGKIYDAAFKWSGSLRGGLGIGTVLTCTIIAAMTGIAATGVTSGGLFAYPEMRKRGYDKRLSLGTVCAAGCLGLLIPPSVLMIIIANLASLSVGKLFMGGIVPGVLTAFLFSLYITVRGLVNPKVAPVLPKEERASWREKVLALKGLVLPGLVIAGVLGGIYAGIATPTEAAGVGALGILISCLVYKTLTRNVLNEAITTTAKLTVMVLWLAVGGVFFASLLSYIGMCEWTKEMFIGLPFSPLVIIIIMQLVALVMGMFMDSIAISIILVPIFVPIVDSLGYSLIWFCLLLTINLVIGLITPPFGVALFYIKGIVPEAKMGEIYKAVIPFVLMYIFVLIMGIIFPDFLLWLPMKMG